MSDRGTGPTLPDDPVHTVFVRRARQASHQALFFLHHLHPTGHHRTDAALTDYAPFAQRQVRVLVGAIAVPPAEGESAVAFWRDQIRPQTEVPEALDLAAAADLRRRFETFLSMTQTLDLRSALWMTAGLLATAGLFLLSSVLAREFLRSATAWLGGWAIPLAAAGWVAAVALWAGRRLGPAIPVHRIEHAAAKLARYLNKHLVLAVVLVAVNAGLASGPIDSLVAFGGWAHAASVLLLVDALPLAIWVGYGHLVRRHGLGERGLLSFTHMALEPERRVRRWPDRARLPRLFLLAALARLAAALIGLSATLAVLAAAGAFTRTSCVVFLLAGLAVVAAHAVDFWDYHDGRMIRFLSLVGATSLVVASLATRYGRAWAIVLLLLLAAWAYRTYGTPVRYVATGLLALLSALTFGGSLIKSRDTWRDPDTPALQRLAAAGEWPFPASGDCDSIVVVMAASGGGSRAAVYAALTLERLAAAYPRIAGRLQCISSVSGGSLANAAYVARLYRHQGRDGPPDLADLPAAAARDYLFPTLFGALVPGISRGGAIERAWRQHAGLDTISTQALVDGWRVARDRRRSTPPFPLPLFNSCTLDGHDLVVSPLPRSAYSQPPHHYRPVAAEAGGAAARPRTDTTWVYDRDAIYGLEDLLPGYNPRLDQAVRASANFPFGFPLVEVETPAANLYLDPEHGAGGGVVTVGLTDGGVLSNSGLWSLYHLLTNHCEVLKPRGVLLIVVEASKMPEYRSDAHQTLALYGAIGDQGPIGQNLIRRMYDLLEQRYGNRLAVVQIDIPPTEGDNVLTTWSLGDGDLAQLRISFATQWRKQADGIAARWRFLQTGLIDGRVPATNPFIPGTDRPPLN